MCACVCVDACVLCTGQVEIKTVFLESGFIRNNQDPDLQSWPGHHHRHGKALEQIQQQTLRYPHGVQGKDLATNASISSNS